MGRYGPVTRGRPPGLLGARAPPAPAPVASERDRPRSLGGVARQAFAIASWNDRFSRKNVRSRFFTRTPGSAGTEIGPVRTRPASFSGRSSASGFRDRELERQVLEEERQVEVLHEDAGKRGHRHGREIQDRADAGPGHPDRKSTRLN